MNYLELKNKVALWKTEAIESIELIEAAVAFVDKKEADIAEQNARRDRDPFSDADYFESGYCT